MRISWNTFWLMAGMTLAGVAAITRAVAQDSSPFIPAGSPAAQSAAAAAEGNLVLAGITVVGGKTIVSVYDSQTKRSQWIPVGATVNDITVVECQPNSNEAVIRANGETRHLTLPKATIVSAPAASFATPEPAVVGASPAPATGDGANAAPPPPAGPAYGTPAYQEQEARMLVTDLLEIGMQQRKAYEEAQKKANDAKAAEAAKKAQVPKPAPAATTPAGK